MPGSRRITESQVLFVVAMVFSVGSQASRASAGEFELLEGTWSWPDQGLSLYFPDGDPAGGAFVHALAEFDSALVVGGSFKYAGGVESQNLAAWNGVSWSPLGGAGTNHTVHTIFETPDALYIGGAFTAVGELSANRVAKWDGKTWSALGNGPNEIVFSFAWWDDGSGSTLYATGLSGRVRKWTGSNWASIGICDSSVQALEVFDDGTGPALYGAGVFNQCGGAGSRIAKWDGKAWQSLGRGVTDTGGFLNALAVFDDGSGAALYAGGVFSEIDGIPATNFARWNGEQWSAVAVPGLISQSQITALKVLDDGSGPKLYVLGAGLRRWDGKTWERYDNGPGMLLGAEIFPGPHGPAVHVGGEITLGDDPKVRTNIARWDPATAGGHPCGDFNGDGITDQADLGILLANYNCPGPGCDGDTDGDGDTDQADLGILLAHFGQKCG